MDRERDVLFKGPTRPPMVFGVTYTFFIVNTMLAVELFIATSDFTYLFIIGPGVHVLGLIACAIDPFFFELWRLRLMRTPPGPNRRVWRCNSYLP